MRKILFIPLLLLFSCKKKTDVARTMYVTYFVKTPLNANQKLYVQYYDSYDMNLPYQYAKIKQDTIAADSFSVMVKYSVPHLKFKGLAGYLAFTILTYQTNRPPIASSLPTWNKFGCIVNGVRQNNYSRDDVYNVTSVYW